MKKTLFSKSYYVLQNTENDNFATLKNVGGFDNEKMKIFWVKNIDKASKFDTMSDLVKFMHIEKNTEKYQIVKIQETTNIVNTCGLNFAI